MTAGLVILSGFDPLQWPRALRACVAFDLVTTFLRWALWLFPVPPL